MPEKSNDTTNFNDDQNKRWKGIKQDPRSGKFIVYVTESSEHLFDDIDSAVDFMVKSSYLMGIDKTAGAPEFSGLERGQENINGVKQVTIRRKLVLDKETGKWKVKESTRTDMIEDDKTSATNTYKDIDNAKEKSEEIIPVDEFIDKEDQTKDVTSSVSYDIDPIAKCSNCGCNIYPYSIDDAVFDREQLASSFCPACGYGLVKPSHNEQSVDALIEGQN